MSKRVYISGPMSGRQNWGVEEFADAEGVLRSMGHRVINPAANFSGDTHHPRTEYMRMDFAHLLQAEAVCLLDGWEGSKGARAEVLVAQEIGLEFIGLQPRAVTTEVD